MNLFKMDAAAFEGQTIDQLKESFMSAGELRKVAKKFDDERLMLSFKNSLNDCKLAIWEAVKLGKDNVSIPLVKFHNDKHVTDIVIFLRNLGYSVTAGSPRHGYEKVMFIFWGGGNEAE